MTSSDSPKAPARLVLHEGRYLPDTGPSRAGWHELADFAVCPQLYAYRYVIHLPDKRKEYFQRGSAFHAGLGASYLRLWARQNDQDPDQFWDSAAAVHHICVAENNLNIERPVQLAVQTYEENVLVPQAAEWNVLGVELEVQAEVEGTEQGITRGIDLVLRSKYTGMVRVLDHKSRSGEIRRIERSYENDMTLDILWRWGMAVYGDNLEGVFLNYVTLPRQAKRPAMVTMELVQTKRSFWREAAIGDTVRYYRGGLRRLLEAGVDPWHWPKLQVGFGAGMGSGICPGCPFLDYCRFGPPREGMASSSLTPEPAAS